MSLETLLIVFREVLEAALVIGIVAAAARGVPGRNRWLLTGVGAGILGSCLVAATTGVIAQWASGMGQELFNAGILSLAVLMLAWHTIWMAQHGREIAQQARGMGEEVRAGRRAASVLCVLVGVSVLREGSETVLFLYGVAASAGAASAWSMTLSGLLGVLLGAGVGYAMYAGLLRIPVRWFFSATGALVLLIAAGMASQVAHYLIQADVLPTLMDPLWDSSRLLAQDSVLGRVLHGLVGYDARPTGMQVVFFLVCAVVIYTSMRWVNRSRPAFVRTAAA